MFVSLSESESELLWDSALERPQNRSCVSHSYHYFHCYPLLSPRCQRNKRCHCCRPAVAHLTEIRHKGPGTMNQVLRKLPSQICLPIHLPEGLVVRNHTPVERQQFDNASRSPERIEMLHSRLIVAGREDFR